MIILVLSAVLLVASAAVCYFTVSYILWRKLTLWWIALTAVLLMSETYVLTFAVIVALE